MANSVSGRILEGSRVLVDGFNTHPFVLGIADGTLPEEKFKFFMIQDYLYLMEYAKVFAVGAAKSYDDEVTDAFTAYVSNIRSGEMDIHRSYMSRLGIDVSEAGKTRMAQDNLSYTSYMLRIAYEAGPAEICAAILPCAVSYEEIAVKMVRENPSCAEHPFYGEWVKGYSGAEYHEENQELIRITDRAAQGCSEAQIQRLIEIGNRCTLYEKSFWDMSWEMRD